MTKLKRGGGRKTPFSNYCIVRDNPNVRPLIEWKLKSTDVDKACESVGIAKSNLYNYLNQGKKNISQFKVIQLLDYLGVEVKIQLKPKDE